MPVTRRREQGLVLVVVLVLGLLLTGSVATFVRRSVVDSMISHHRDDAARAEGLARGGVRLAIALLLEDLVEERETNGFEVESLQDPWARIGEVELDEDGAELALRIRDTGSRLNLNALFDEEGRAGEHTELLLTALFEKVLEEVPEEERPREGGREPTEPAELARTLIDYVDRDEVGRRGDLEDDWYQQQDPPYRAANRPLLSVAELGLVRGFGPELVDALEPYVTVYPFTGGDGINPNTAPPHVLSLLYAQDALDARGSRLAEPEAIRDLLERREDGATFCDESFVDENTGIACTGIGEVIPQQIYPAPTFRSHVFLVEAEATVGDVRRVVEAVIDREDPTAPRLLAWRVQ